MSRARALFLPSAEPDASGRPHADPRVERVALVVTVLACTWFALAAFWGINAPFGSGHVSSIAARGIIAENIWQWHILAPVKQIVLEPPDPALYYSHHPWGLYWPTALIYKIFGRQDLVCRLQAALLSSACPVLLYATGRALYGPVQGAVAALAFATLPITLAFANFNGYEVAVVFAGLFVTWSTIRMWQTWRKRYLLLSILGVLWAVNTDWEVYVFLALAVGVLGTAGIVLPSGWFGRVDIRRFAQWWMFAVGISVLGGVGYLAVFKHFNHLDDLLQSATQRSAGNDLPLEKVLEHRRYWIALMFTPLAIFIAKAAVPLFALRFVLLRRVLDIFPLALLAMAGFEYVYFKQAADVHIYWPHVFSPYYALSVAVFAHVFEQSLSRLVRWIRRREAVRGPAYAALGVSALVPLAILPDGASTLVYSKHTGQRMNDDGHVIYQDVDRAAALEWIRHHIEGRTTVATFGMQTGWSVEWALDRPTRATRTLPNPRTKQPERYFLFDARFLAGEQQLTLMKSFAITTLGPIWLLDREASRGPADVHILAAKQPTLLQRYFIAPVDPVYRVEKDPFATWEVRYHYEQTPNPPPTEPAATAEQRRIAHNVAVANGDTALAQRLEGEIVAELDTSVATDYEDGTRLIGQHYDSKLRHELWLYFRAGGPAPGARRFSIRTTVLEKKPLSLVTADDKVKGVAALFEIDPTLWKKGFVYVAQAEIRKRPGRERFVGYWMQNLPRAVDGKTSIRLLELH